jgi:hypothetical protein
MGEGNPRMEAALQPLQPDFHFLHAGTTNSDMPRQPEKTFRSISFMINELKIRLPQHRSGTRLLAQVPAMETADQCCTMVCYPCFQGN